MKKAAVKEKLRKPLVFFVAHRKKERAGNRDSREHRNKNANSENKCEAFYNRSIAEKVKNKGCDK